MSSKIVHMNMSTKVGIIVPIYKVEKYIAECIESILAQTYKDFRLILVDDGSPDNAGKICDEYAKKDSRITVIHQENAGVTRARARGVEEAGDCEFITFVDGDDTIKNDALENLLKRMGQDTDIVIFDRHTAFVGIEYISIEDYRRYLISEKPISLAPWGKLFRKCLFEESIFDIPRDIIVAEDMIMNIRLSFKTEKNVQIIQERIYNYREYDENTIHSFINTIDYIHRRHKLKMASIPDEIKEKYISSTIRSRLFWLRDVYGYKYKVHGMKSHEYYKELKSDIKKYQYKLSFVDKIIFTYESPIIRFIAINIKKLINKIQSS